MRFSAISVFALFLACSGSSLKVGSDESGGGDDAGGNSSVAAAPNAGGVGASAPSAGGVGASAPTTGGVGGTDGLGGTTGRDAGPPITTCNETFPFEGEWRGNLLDYLFEPMDELRLSVRAQGGQGGYVGELTWGAGDPPAPATDPNAPYPPGLEVGGAAGSGGGRNPSGSDFWPGYPYEIVRGAGCDGVFRATLSIYEIWDSWCSLQQSFYSEPAQRWACVELGDGASLVGSICQVNEDSKTIAEHPMWRCNLCGVLGSSVCACNESGCWASTDTTHAIELSLIEADGVDVLTGPYDGCHECTIRLEREE